VQGHLSASVGQHLSGGTHGFAAEEVGWDVVALVDGRSFDWLARRGALIDALQLVESAPRSAPRVLGAFLAAAGAPRRVCRGVAPRAGP
jgi:hypothetical protein